MELYNWVKENFVVIVIIALMIYYLSSQNTIRHTIQHYVNLKSECSKETINEQHYDYVTNKVGRFVR
jgi:hypothetical protein